MSSRACISTILAVTAAICGCERSASNHGTTAAPDRPNVLLITLDTTRADRLGCYGHTPARTPALDALADTGVRFAEAFCQVPLTLPSHAALLTGTNPPSNGIRINAGGVLSKELLTLAEVFQQRGYRTGAFIGAWVLDSTFGLDRGFDLYDDQIGGNDDLSNAITERRGDEVCDAALTWLEQQSPRPFFAWVHFFDPHHPYDPPEGYRAGFAHPYDGEIAFMDAQVARLVRWLDEHQLRAQTLIVAVGDHGEAFDEHDETQHGLFVYDTTLRVPLIFSCPTRLPGGRVVTGGVRLIDVMPTVMEWMGWSRPADIDGESRVEALRTGVADFVPVYAETEYPRLAFGWSPLRCVITAEWKYIAAPRPELYDRAADPRELQNVIAEHPAAARELQDELDQLLTDARQRLATAVALDERMLERLSSLGYVGGAAPGDDETAAPRHDPKDMVAVYRGFMKAKGAAQLQRHGEVVALLEPLVRQSPESDTLRAALGEAYLALERFAEARAEYEASLRTLSWDPRNWCGLGDVCRAQHQTEGAIAAYRRALEESPDYGQAHSRLGLVFAQQNDFQQAEAHFRRYVELSPRSPNALANLANVLMPLGRSRDAVELLRQALQIDPQYGPAHRALWRALKHSGQRAAALTAVRAALKILPEDRALMGELAWLLATSPEAGLRNGPEALRWAERIAGPQPTDARALDILAAAHAENGDFLRAVELARQALDLATGQRQTTLRQAIVARLRLYEAQRPHHE